MGNFASIWHLNKDKDGTCAEKDTAEWVYLPCRGLICNSTNETMQVRFEAKAKRH